MKTLVRADAKRRLCISGAEPGEEYVVESENGGWRITPAAENHRPEAPVPRNRREWAGSKRSLDEHLQALSDAGLRIERAENAKQPPPPCRF